jgi:hypothetical protein
MCGSLADELEGFGTDNVARQSYEGHFNFFFILVMG